MGQVLRYKTLRRSFTRGLGMVLGASLLTSPVWACSGVGPPGKPVVFGDQTNIVIWDEAHRTEHFIRNANFKSGAPDFGFIAPTPGKPQLSEASNKAFYTLAALAPIQPTLRGGFGGGGFGGAREETEVKVIQEADVAGYHATTVWSTDAHAINDWMNSHGYVSTPEVEKWADRYCRKGWYLTAFKVMDRTKLAASTGTVRMSFITDHPYNPFYVPATNIPINGGGTLRVYFVSVGDYDAQIGDGTRAEGNTWQVPQWTAAIPHDTANQLAQQIKLPSRAVPARSQVEAFVDYNFPRPAADDIYFVKRETAPIRTPERTSPPIMLPLLAGVGLLAVGRRRR